MKPKYIFSPYGPDSNRYEIYIVSMRFNSDEKEGSSTGFSLAISNGKALDWWRVSSHQEPGVRALQRGLYDVGRDVLTRFSDVEQIAFRWLKKNGLDKRYRETVLIQKYPVTILPEKTIPFISGTFEDPQWVLVKANVADIILNDITTYSYPNFFLVALPRGVKKQLAKAVVTDYIVENKERLARRMIILENCRTVIPYQYPILDFINPWIYDNRLMWKRVAKQLSDLDAEYHTHFLESELYWEAKSKLISEADYDHLNEL